MASGSPEWKSQERERIQIQKLDHLLCDLEENAFPL